MTSDEKNDHLGVISSTLEEIWGRRMIEVFKDKKHCCEEEGNKLFSISIAERPRINRFQLVRNTHLRYLKAFEGLR